MPESDCKTVIQRAYQAFNTRDIDAAVALMTHDVTWPKASEGGVIVGHAEIRAYWTRQWQVFDPRVDPLSLREERDGTIVVTARQLVKSPQGAVLSDSEVIHVFTLRAGLISSMDVLGLSEGPAAEFVH